MAVTTVKQELLERAAECFMEKGFEATSIDDVARRLGSTKGRVYHYYASKTDLFFDIHREGMVRLFDAVKPAMKSEGDGVTVLAAMLKAHAMALFEHHAFESVVVQGVQLHKFGALTPGQRRVLDELIENRDRFEGLFKHQLQRARTDRSLGSLDVSIAAKTILGGLQWSLIWYKPELDRSAVARARLADKMVATLVQGLRRRD